MSDWNQSIIDEFRASGGNLGGPFEGVTLLLLHTTGAKSGQERINPLLTRLDGDDLIVFASKAGAPTNPDWFHNLLADPHARVELGTETIDVVARVAERDERDRLWERNKQENPGFADYEAATTRAIPVVVLERA